MKAQKEIDRASYAYSNASTNPLTKSSLVDGPPYVQYMRGGIELCDSFKVNH